VSPCFAVTVSVTTLGSLPGHSILCHKFRKRELLVELPHARIQANLWPLCNPHVC